MRHRLCKGLLVRTLDANALDRIPHRKRVHRIEPFHHVAEHGEFVVELGLLG